MRYTIGSLPSGSLQNAQAPVGKSRESCIGPRKGDECFIPAGNDEPCAGIIFRLRSFLELFALRLLENHKSDPRGYYLSVEGAF